MKKKRLEVTHKIARDAAILALKECGGLDYAVGELYPKSAFLSAKIKAAFELHRAKIGAIGAFVDWGRDNKGRGVLVIEFFKTRKGKFYGCLLSTLTINAAIMAENQAAAK